MIAVICLRSPRARARNQSKQAMKPTLETRRDDGSVYVAMTLHVCYVVLDYSVLSTEASTGGFLSFKLCERRRGYSKE